MAAQVQEPLIPPDHLPTVALRNNAAEVVIDTLTRNTAQPIEHTHVPFQERLERHVEAEVRGLRAGERQRRDQRIDPSLD